MIEQLSLFDTYPHGSPEEIIVPDGHLQLYRSIFSDAQVSSYYNQLKKEIRWQQDSITLFGKSQPLPRLTAWYGDPERSYTYSGIAMEPTPWTPLLQTIKAKAETLAKVTFNSVLLNFYRTGEDGVSWHADDEPELKKGHPIASVSFGATRRFLLKHKTDSTIDKVELMLTSGSVLLMLDTTQEYWLHQIPKTKKFVNPRINLTFRFIK
ncbi:alpha-ketoglutarate-dependent dioxygenase AlkB family protein [Synechocystis salina]|uniref:Alpha-ketoglutarate-dependent dioxygenase AlkB n=1 Tax=Synechocystis salina LEGE 00031 TaxID=1828736 RepID=A0ABR9VYX4_9SYNC|nr:alpha-ketoglutarate-dependent dioxygenase AlkB [Synechocystis salina]MBE9241198.1 alpha-ketoglutarate-dependent dioxygenase AlkB [Synechocystis salina LEGE 00041]MBE9255578.1 alpha-ketoglutarate-dependent dioxygenase AlkB [Synechocystis salina LEGE 00031]